MKRRQRGRPLSTPTRERGENPLDAIARAALQFAEDTERPTEGNPKAEYKRALHTFEQALYRYKVTSGGRLRFRRRDGQPFKSGL